jgi:CheY-like chemotaxis protein
MDRRLASLEASFNKENELVRPGFVLSREFATLLGGSLDIKPSDIGSGHSFSFQVPVGNQLDVPMLSKKSEPRIGQRVIELIQKKANRLSGVRVLLAEDSSDNEALMRLFLKKEGVVLTSVSNGLEAVDAVKNADFDLILMDIQMPLMDGLEATRQIRQLGFEKPIIALTGDALLGDAERSLRAGCSTHLTKPIQKEVLINEIQKHVFH